MRATHACSNPSFRHIRVAFCMSNRPTRPKQRRFAGPPWIESMLERIAASGTPLAKNYRSAAEWGRNTLLGIARRIYRECYGKLPRVRPLHPYWAAMRHLIRLIDRAAENGAANVMVVIGSGGVADTVADHLPGVHSQISLSELLE